MIDRLYHRFYLWAQKRQSWAKRWKDPSFRTYRHLDFVKPLLPRPLPGPVLCLGPRNRLELDFLRGSGFRDVIGLDLFSTSPDIHVGDMHDMSFQTHRFGMVWASHVIEHARDPQLVFAEINRVVKPGGYVFVAYPTDFKINWHDRHDHGPPVLLPFRRYIAAKKTEAKGTAEWAALFQA